MAKVLFIVAQKGFRDEELLVPKEMLEKAGHTVRIASLTRGKAIGSRGAEIQPDMAIYEANPDFFEAVVIVGGPGSPILADKSEVLGLLRAMAQKGKLIAGICLGPMALARSGVLAGRDATIFPDRKAILMLRECGARYLMEPVVVDERIITADGPENAGLFGQGLIDLLKKPPSM
jgi:protease I